MRLVDLPPDVQPPDSGQEVRRGPLLARHPALMAVGVQAAAWGLGLSGVVLGLPLDSPIILAWLIGAFAAGIACAVGMPLWWLPIHLVFVPATVWALGLDLNPLWPLAAFVALAVLYGAACWTRAPLFLTTNRTVSVLSTLLPRNADAHFIDLGSGLGGVLARLHVMRPELHYHGVETAWLPFIFSQARNLVHGCGWQLRHGNLWSMHLGDYDVVYAYLSPAAMASLWRKARREMRPGSLLVSNSFIVPEMEPSVRVEVGDWAGSVLYLWRM